MIRRRDLGRKVGWLIEFLIRVICVICGSVGVLASDAVEVNLNH